MHQFNGLWVDGASVIGSSHQSRQRNNQDSWSVAHSRHAVVAAVADGSSSGPYSEIGARIATRFLVARGVDILPSQGADHLVVARRLLSDLVDELHRLSGQLTAPGEPEALTIADMFLFTVLLAIVDNDSYSILSVGDGLFGVDEKLVSLDGGAGFGPSYCMYAVLKPEDIGRSVDTEPRLQATGASEDISNLLIATDGCSELLQSSVHDSQSLGQLLDVRGQRSNLLQSRVESLVAERGQPYDDATLVWMRSL